VRRLSLEDCQDVAKQREGHCLATSYRNSSELLLWRCAKGHTWQASFSNVKYGGRWCPHCTGRYKTLEDLRSLAVSRGGECLSQSYANSREPLQWECSRGHRWETGANSVTSGSWCPKCAKVAPRTLEEMQKLAESKGGKCLSSTYVRAGENLSWECAKGHRWEATPGNVTSRNSWCPYCAGCARLKLSDLQGIAASKKGLCLSTEYRNNRNRLHWRCSKGHEWEAKATHVIQGSWCPYCNNWVGEETCRKWLEVHFSAHFPKAWPQWLKVTSSHPLGLDGYNEDLRLAFEYQGPQHFKFTTFFHRTRLDFEMQVERDRKKAEACASRGVTLLVVPFMKITEIPEYLRKLVGL